jgi:hypothetical protein
MELTSMTSPISVWLYGSHARGDSDRISDKDVLLVCDRPNELQHFLQQIEVDNLRLSDCSVSQYSWSEIRNMARDGSLFLQHVKLEGLIVYESPECRGLLRKLLMELPAYSHAGRDVEAFRTVLADVREELLAGSPSSFELGVIGTVVRHASSLGCYMVGVPCFSRTEPVKRISEACGLPRYFSRDFLELYRYRLIHEGRPCDPPMNNPYSDQQWLEWAECLVNFVGDLCHERTSYLSAAGGED